MSECHYLQKRHSITLVSMILVRYMLSHASQKINKRFCKIFVTKHVFVVTEVVQEILHK